MEPPGYRVKNILADFREKLHGMYPDREIMQFAYMLFEEYLGWERTMVHLSQESEIPRKLRESFDSVLAGLQEGRPVQYILGKAWFNGILLKVDENVLIPRIETEELSNFIKADLRGMKDLHFSLLDIGTGSGCIAIDLKRHFVKAGVWAMDNSQAALEVARGNARVNQCSITFIHSDILDKSGWNDLGNFGVIVSNPPYVPESEKPGLHLNVLAFEPEQALFVPDKDPLVFYRTIAEFAAGHLDHPGKLYFEIHERFGAGVINVILASGFTEAVILKDFNGKDRFVTATLH